MANSSTSSGRVHIRMSTFWPRTTVAAMTTRLGGVLLNPQRSFFCANELPGALAHLGPVHVAADVGDESAHGREVADVRDEDRLVLQRDAAAAELLAGDRVLQQA